jgi:hypothetical protein
LLTELSITITTVIYTKEIEYKYDVNDGAKWFSIALQTSLKLLCILVAEIHLCLQRPKLLLQTGQSLDKRTGIPLLLCYLARLVSFL